MDNVDEASVFTRILDAQADLIVQLDELTMARERENDPTIWVNRGATQMGPHFIFLEIANNELGATPLVIALVERAVALVLRISRVPPTESPTKTARAPCRRRNQSVSRLDDSISPRDAPDGSTEPTLALLAVSELLLGLLQSTFVMREVAAQHCADEVADFLIHKSFYRALESNRVTRLAAAHLQQATRLITSAEDSSKAAKDKQRGRHHQ